MQRLLALVLYAVYCRVREQRCTCFMTWLFARISKSVDCTEFAGPQVLNTSPAEVDTRSLLMLCHCRYAQHFLKQIRPSSKARPGNSPAETTSDVPCWRAESPAGVLEGGHCGRECWNSGSSWSGERLWSVNLARYAPAQR